MAEPADLTQAEILARQRMLEEALARQNADAEVFGRINDPRPTERPIEYEYGAVIDYGPEGQLPVDMTMGRILGEGALLQGAVAGARDLFTGERREVLEPATVTYKDLPDRFNPLTGRFEPRTEETITPGRYGPADKSFRYSPLYRGAASAGQYIEDLLQDPAKRDEALEMIKKFPEILNKQTRLTVESALRGGERVVDPESGMSGSPSDLLLASTGLMGASGAASALRGIDGGVTLGSGPIIRLQGWGDERKDPPPPQFDESGSQKDLLFTHELREEELWRALDSGGLSSPSLGLGRETESASGFGEIILVGKPEAFNPANDSRNIIFSGDAYTPRHPFTFFKQKQELANPEVRAEKIREDFGFMETISDFSDSNLAWANDGFGRAGKYPVTGTIIGPDYGSHEPAGWFLDEKQNPLLVYKFLKDEGHTEAGALSLEVPPRLKTDTGESYDPELTNNALKVINDNIESSSEARSTIVRMLSETLEGNPALQERYKKWLKDFKSRYVEADEKGEPVAYLERYGDDGTTLVEATPENVVEHMKAEDLRLGESPTGFTQDVTVGPMFARTARELPSNVAAKQYADTPDISRSSLTSSGASAGMPPLLREKDSGQTIVHTSGGERLQTLTPQQLRDISKQDFGRSISNTLRDLPMPEALKNEFLNKAIQLAPDVDAVRAVVRERYGSLADMAEKPSLTSFILGESRNPITKSNLEEQIEKTTQSILKLEREAQWRPKKYFESKPQRVVGMDEFAGAIVPTYASEDLVDALKAQGLKVVKYRQGTDFRDEDRAWNSVVDAKQQFRDEMFSISGDGGLTAATLGAVGETTEEASPKEFDQERAWPTDFDFSRTYANGGMVNSMNRFPQAGPLARQAVPRETMVPMGYDNGGGVDATAFARSQNRDFQTAEEGFRSRPSSSTENEIDQLKWSLKDKSINEIYETAGSLGVRLPRGLGRDNALDVFINEILFRSRLPVTKRGDTFAMETELPGGGRFGLHANPEQKAGGISLSKRFDNGGEVQKYDVPMPNFRPGLELPLDERFTQPGPYDMGPLQQIIPEEESWRDLAERNLAGALGDDRQAYRRAGTLMDTADVIPGVGDVAAAADVMQAVKDVDPMGMGIAAAGVIPGGRKALGKVREFLKEKFMHDRTPQYPTGTFPRHRMQPPMLEDPNVKYDPFRESFDFEGNFGRRAASFPEHDKELLQRAKEQGFNTDQVLYHYTTQLEKGPDGKLGELTSIKPSKSGTYGPGVYLSPDPFYAQRYALDAKDVKKFGESARAIPVVVRGKLANTADFVDAMNQAQKEVSKITKTFSPEKIKIAADDILRQKGFSGKQVNMYGENEFVVFDPKDIRSINAEFDPDFKDSAELLKAQGGEVQSFQVGGNVFGLPDFTGRVLATDTEDDVTAAETLAATTSPVATTMPAGLNRLQQELVASGDLQLEDLGYPKNTVKGADPTVTSVFQTTTPAEDLIETTTDTSTDTTTDTTDTTTEPVVVDPDPVVVDPVVVDPVVVDPVVVDPVVVDPAVGQVVTDPVIVDPLTPWPTTTEATTDTTDTTTEPVLETTTEPVTETTTDTAPLIVTDPLASEELSSLTEQVDETPVGLVPSPTAEDVTTFTIQEQPDAPDEQPFVPITGVSPDLSVNQYLDTTYETGYPTTQGMEIKESLIPGQEYSAERLAAGQMMDVIKPDLGSGAPLPSVDFSNIGFDVDDDTEEVETETYVKPEVGMTSAEVMDVNAYNLAMQRPYLTGGEPVNWRTMGEGLSDFTSNPLRALSDIPIKVADRIWSNRPAFILATYARDEDDNLLRNEKGEFYRRDGLGTLINRILDKIDDGRANRFFREYNEETGQLEGQNWLQKLLGSKEGTDVSDKTEEGQRNFRTDLMNGLTAGLQMMNPLNLFRTPEAGQQQSTVPQTGVPSADPVVTLPDGSEYSSWKTVPMTAENYRLHLEAVADWIGPGAETANKVLDQHIVELVGMVDDERGTWTNMTAEQQWDYINRGLEQRLQTDPYMKKLRQLGLIERLSDLPASMWSSELKSIAETLQTQAENVGEAYERYAEGRGVHPIWGARMGSIDETGSGFGYSSLSMGGGSGGAYLGPGGDFFPDRISGTGRLPAAGGSWGGLNPFAEVPGPGDPMYADYLMDTLGPSKYQQNEIERMVAQTLPFFEAVGEDGKYYLMSKETGEVLYGPYDNPNTSGGGTSPGGGMAHGGPVVRNVGETEGIAGLFEDMMGPGRIDETERVYEYPGGTMTERVSRGSFNMRTG